MKVKQFILAFIVFILASGACLALALLYVYHQPSTLKRLVEDSLSAHFGLEVTIRELEYDLQPMQVRAASIAVRDAQSGDDLELSVSRLSASFALEGPLGRRTLVIEQVALAGVSLTSGKRMNWEGLIPDTGPPSALSRLVKRAAAALLFRDVRIGMVELSDGEAALATDELQLALRRIRAGTTADGIRVDGEVRIQWPATGAVFDAPQFSTVLNLVFSADQDVFSGQLRMPAARYTSPQANVTASQAEVHVALAVGPERIALEDGRVLCQSLTLEREGMEELPLHAPRLSVAGEFGRGQRVLKVARWQLTVDELLDLSGEAELKLGAARTLDIKRIDGVLFPAKLIPTVLLAAGYKRAPVQITGTVGINGSLILKETERGWIEDGDVTAAFDRNAVKAVLGSLRMGGVVTGTVRGSGRASAPTIATQLSGRQILLNGSGLRIEPFAVDVSAEGTYPAFSVPLLDLRIPVVALPVADKLYALNDLVLRATNTKIEADRMSVSCPEIIMASDVLRNLKASAAGDLRQMTVDVSGSATGWAEAAARSQLLPTGWRLYGVDRFQARAVIRPDGESRLTSTLELRDLSFADAAECCAGEDIALRAEITARARHQQNAIAVVASLHASGGEFLWDRFYLNPGKNPVTVSADLHYAMSGRSLKINSARLELEHLLALNVAGHLVRKGSQTAYDLKLQALPAPAAPVFAAFIAEPLRYRQPVLAAVQVDGLLAAQLHVAAEGKRRSLRGQVDWQSGSAVTADKTIRLEGIELRLPLWYQSEGAEREGPPMNGKLAIRRVTVPMLPVQELMLPFDVRPNQLNTTGELRVRFPVGEARLGAVSGRDLFSPSPKIETRLTVERVQVGGFLKGLWASPVDAVVSGELEGIVFDGRDVRTRGRLAADIFKGQIVIENPGVDAVFSAAPNLRTDCLIRDVSLADATQDTSFGRIQGVLGGRLEHLEIVGGQPQRFTLLLETIRTQGVPQRINVEAVENIARIGGGQSPFVGLAGNIASFFKEFTYDKIGIRAVLENDVFKINGAVKEGGVEYLVKRGGIPGVDVINLNPANQISFKDMVKRIRRVTESKSGPVVN
jgi:hypothetical protein